MYKLYFFVLLFIYSTRLVFSQSDSLLESGLIKQKEGNHEMAIMDFSQAIKTKSLEVQAHIKKWDEYQKASNFERAEKGLEVPPTDTVFARSYYLRGMSYAAIRKNDEAIDDFTIAVKLNPKYGEAYYERGKLLLLTEKKYEGCMDMGMARCMGDSLAKEMMYEKLCCNEAALYYKEAMLNIVLNQYPIALDLIQKSIRLSPDSITYLVARGNCYSGMGKLDLAFLDFDKAIAAVPNNKDAYFGRGVAFYTKRKYQEAFTDFDKAIHINEEFADAYLYRAYACEGMNKIQSALYDYLQVQRLKPHDALAYYKSGLLKNENKDTAGACVDFKKAASLGNTEAADYAKGCK